MRKMLSLLAVLVLCTAMALGQNKTTTGQVKDGKGDPIPFATIKIKGTNNHHDHAGIGSALPDYMHYYRVGLLKNLGVNAYRTSHGAPNIELLDACDSLGMLVIDEQRLLNSSPEYISQFER